MTKVQVDSNGKVITLGGKALVASEGGSATLITKNITQNGTYAASSDNADGYSSVTVNVAGTTPTGTLSITANGVYDVTNYASADVSVSGGGGDNIVYDTATSFEVTYISDAYDIVDIIIAEGVNTGNLAVAYVIDNTGFQSPILTSVDVFNPETGEISGHFFAEGSHIIEFTANIDDLIGYTITTLPDLIKQEYFN